MHATIAGVVLGLLAPTRPFRHPDMVDADQLADVSTVEHRAGDGRVRRESVSVVEWLEYQLHPWSSYVIVPIFALANAGVVISSDSIADTAASPVTHGIVVGLVVGKAVGIFGFTWSRAGSAFARARRARWPHRGIAVLGGIGFTVSLFVSDRVPRKPEWPTRRSSACSPRGHPRARAPAVLLLTIGRSGADVIRARRERARS